MADAILKETEAIPPLDTVLLSITNTVERDYVSRGVFPGIRTKTAWSVAAASSLHFLTQAQTKEIREDAAAMYLHSAKGMKSAYGALVKVCDRAIADAQERFQALSGDDAYCCRQWEGYERWWGTKKQLTAKGIRLPGAWPGEPNGKKWRKGVDSRGHEATVCIYSSIWPGFYQVEIRAPWKVTERQRDATKAERALQSMPKTADAFRREVLAQMRSFVRVSLELATKPSDFHGFRLSDEAAEGVHEAFDAIVEAVAAAPVIFDAGLQASLITKHRAEIAGADQTFQQKLGALKTGKLHLVKGEA